MTQNVVPGRPARRIQVWNQIFVAILVVTLLYFVVSYVNLVLQHTALREEISQATTNLQVVKELGLRLERQLQYVRTDAYKETVAREKLGMARSGDRVVAIIADGSLSHATEFLSSAGGGEDILSLPIWRQWLLLFNLETGLALETTSP